MMDFSLWFINQLPGFLLTPPISALVGLGMSSVVIGLVGRLIRL